MFLYQTQLNTRYLIIIIHLLVAGKVVSVEYILN